MLGTGGVILLVVMLSYCLCSGLAEEEDESITEVKPFRQESFKNQADDYAPTASEGSPRTTEMSKKNKGKK